MIDRRRIVNRLWAIPLAVLACQVTALEMFQDFRSAKLVKSETVSDIEYPVPLAEIRRSGRGWAPEKTRPVQGDVVSSLYEISRSANLEDVYRHYRDQLLTDQDTDILFECLARDCGSSNAWANNYFQDYRLYGADANQSLLVVLDRTTGAYHTLYVNRRGAGDVMVRLDRILPTDKQVAPMSEAQFELQDTPSIRRFLESNAVNKQVVAIVSSQGPDIQNALREGDEAIVQLKRNLGVRLSANIRFVNVGSLGKEEYGTGLVTFILD